MRKWLILGFTTLVLFSFFTSATHADELTVICTKGDCDSTPVEQFFSSKKVWFPGKSVTRTITIWNKSETSQTIGLEAKNITTIGKLDEVIHLVIDRTDGTRIWNGPLHMFYDSGVIIVQSQLKHNEATQLKFLIYMYMTAEDEYQNMNTQFDLDIGFVVPLTVTPKPCHITKEPATPNNVIVGRINNNAVSVKWDMISEPVTGYSIMWGTDYVAETGGILHVGKTNTAAIQRLSEGIEQYRVKVRANNSCLAGLFSVPSFVTSPTLTTSPTSINSPSTILTQTPTSATVFKQSIPPHELSLIQEQGFSSKPVFNTALPGTERENKTSQGQIKGVAISKKNVQQLCDKVGERNIFIFILIILLASFGTSLIKFKKQVRIHLFILFNCLIILSVLFRLLPCLFASTLFYNSWKVVFPFMLGGYTLFMLYHTQKKE